MPDIDFIKVLERAGGFAVILLLFYQNYKKVMTDISNTEVDRRAEERNKVLINELILLRKETNNILLVLAGKFLTKEQLKPLVLEAVNSKFKDMKLVFYSKIDKNNVSEYYKDLLDEIDLQVENSKIELENVIKQSSNEVISKEFMDSFESSFEKYRQYIRKLFSYYRINHNKNTTKRSVSNLTEDAIQSCINSLEVN